MTDDEFFEANPDRTHWCRAPTPDEIDAVVELPPGLRWIIVTHQTLAGAFVRRIVCLAETGDLSEAAAEHLFFHEGANSPIAILTRDFHGA